MENKISLDIVLEILELQKKKMILSGENRNLKELQDNLSIMENKRQEIIRGNQDVINEVLLKYKQEEGSLNEQI